MIAKINCFFENTKHSSAFMKDLFSDSLHSLYPILLDNNCISLLVSIVEVERFLYFGVAKIALNTETIFFKYYFAQSS